MSFYGLIVGVAIVIGVDYFTKHTKVIPSKYQNRFIFGLLVSSVIGARIYHVIDQWAYYSSHLYQIPQTWKGGLGIYGAIIFGLAFTFTFAKINKISFLNILDTITPILPLCQFVGRFGNYVNHEIPFWWLEAILNLALFFLLRNKLFRRYPTFTYLMGYGLIRFFTEFFRQDTGATDHLKVVQIISLLFVAVGFSLFKINYTKDSNRNKHLSFPKN